MRTALLTSALLLAPGLAAAQQCTLPDNAAAAAPPPRIAAAVAPASAAIPKPRLAPERIAATPALRALAAKGAELYDLGIQHGLPGVFARAADGKAFQVFYLSPDGEAVVAGEMFDMAAADPDARRVTLAQIRDIPGVVPTVDMRGGRTPPQGPAATPAAAALDGAGVMEAIEGTAHGLVGRDGAPRVWMVFDPLCPHSVAAMEQMRPEIEAGRIQVALVPVPMLDPAGTRPNTAAALSLLVGPGEAMGEGWATIVAAARARRPVTDGAPMPVEARARLEHNWSVARRLGVTGSPTLIWRRVDGAPAVHTGEGGTGRILASLGR